MPMKQDLTSFDLAEATKALITQAQSEGITEEEINKWNVYHNERDHFWKCRSRLDKYPDSLHLLYLPRQNPITELLIQH